jgi:tetratricopeptide (TPR) repeat protein
MFQSHFQRVSRRLMCQWCLLALVALSMGVETSWTQATTQADEILLDRIRAYRLKIDTAASWHATDDQLGVVWLQLASDYADEFEIQRSEEAYAHSLKLLKNSPIQTHYAIALDNLGSFYLTTGRLKEAENCRRKALAVYEGLGDQAGAARARVGFAIVLLHEHKYSQSEDETAKALKSLQEQKEPNLGDMIAGLISSSYAKCFQGRCDEGLVAARQAMNLFRASVPKDALIGAAALLAFGFEQWKTGALADGDKTMREALEVLRNGENIPQAVLVDTQLRALSRYEDFLKATHQKASAKQVKDEIVRLKGKQTPFCRDCTVNATALTATLQ